MDEKSNHVADRPPKRTSLASSSAKTVEVETPPTLPLTTSSKGTHQEQLLHEAAINNDIALAKRLVDSRIGIDSKTHMERTPCHWAAMHGHLDILAILLHAKCNVESADKFGMRPLLVASWYGHKGAVQMLIENGANCRAVNKQGHGILHCAAKNEQADIVKYSLSCVERIDVNMVDNNGQTALHFASINNDLETVQRLCESGSDISIKDKNHRTAAHWAAAKGHHEVLDLLLRLGANANERAEDKKTALHLASEFGHLRVVQALLKHACDTLAVDSKGRSALHVAAPLGYVDVISELLACGNCALDGKDRHGNRALHCAVVGNQPLVVKLLVQKGAAVNATNNRMQTPLHIAAEMGFTEVSEMLLHSGADLSLPEKSGRTALYIAARGSFTAIVDMLIKAEREKERRQSISTVSNCSQKSIVERHVSVESADTQGTFTCDSNCECNNGESFSKQMRELLWTLARHHMEMHDWKKLARHWGFTEEHIKAIEHQYTGRTSYKEHGYRMMLIWLHGLPSNKNPVKELFEGLVAIDRREAADKIRKKAETSIIFTARRRRRCYCISTAGDICNYCSIF